MKARLKLHTTEGGLVIEEVFTGGSKLWQSNNAGAWVVSLDGKSWVVVREPEVPQDVKDAARGYQQERQGT